jgi:putative phage-type endonuclease
MIKISQDVKNRTKGIGGSDIAGILNVSPYSSPYQIYLEKKGEYQKEESEQMYWGNILENLVAKEFARRNNKKVKKCNYTIVHTEYPFIIANVDRLIVGEKAILEIKTTKDYNYNDFKDGVPVYYLTQVQHYLMVTGFEKAYVAVLIGGSTYVQHEIQRDEEIIATLLKAEINFWNNYVLKSIAPEVNYKDNKYLGIQYQNTTDEFIYLSEDLFKDKIDYRFKLDEAIKKLEKEKAEIDVKFKNELKNHEMAVCDNYEIYWKKDKNNVRRFSIKEMKNGN